VLVKDGPGCRVSNLRTLRVKAGFTMKLRAHSRRKVPDELCFSSFLNKCWRDAALTPTRSPGERESFVSRAEHFDDHGSVLHGRGGGGFFFHFQEGAAARALRVKAIVVGRCGFSSQLRVGSAVTS